MYEIMPTYDAIIACGKVVEIVKEKDDIISNEMHDGLVDLFESLKIQIRN